MAEGLELEALEVGALPIVRTLLDRLGWRPLLERAFEPPDRRLRLSHVDTALRLVCNFALSHHPLYGVSAWGARFGARALGLAPRAIASNRWRFHRVKTPTVIGKFR